MIEERERELRWMLAELQRSYSEAAKPIVDELVDLEMRKPPRPVIIPMIAGEVPTRIRGMIADTERQIRETFFGGLKLECDPSLPPNAVEFRHASGRVDRFKIEST